MKHPIVFLLLAAVAGCECSPDPLAGGDAGTDAVPTPDGMVRPDAVVDGTTDGDASGVSCGAVTCGLGERCEVVMDIPTCVPNECTDLMCSATERCADAPDGRGKYCEDISCNDDIHCDASEFCNGAICVADVCSPGNQSCSMEAIEECAPNGSALTTRFSCGGDAYFVSTCTDDGMGSASCPCQDDWDCPAFTACDVNECAGSGTMPSCFLPPEPFTAVLPTQEPGFPWGGTFGSRNAVGSPFPASSQVVVTPVVINLDDDTGDGLINERDFPEIVFMTFCDSSFTQNGVLRAVHGGGPNRGADFFATCGSTQWNEGDPLDVSCGCGTADLDPTAGIAAGDLDGDGVPEIVVITENDRVRIYSNTGAILGTHNGSGGGLGGSNPSPSIVDVDGVAPAEIVVGRNVFTVEKDAMTGNFAFVDRFEGDLANGVQSQGPISCVADLNGDGVQEIVAGSTAYRMPAAPPGATRRADCTGAEVDPDHVAFCDGELAVLWDGRTVNGSSARREGFCAIADVLGADSMAPPGPMNPLDGAPEVVVIADGRLQVYRGSDGALLVNDDLGAGGRGGAPNIDDFDGDGFPEIGTAFSADYRLLDLQPPTPACPAWPNRFDDDMMGMQGNPARTPPSGACRTDADCGDASQFGCNETLSQCVCLHNGWRRRTEDNSSRVTGSSVFDFNGDGAAEVIYNDECYFRVYSGTDGEVLFRELSESRTRTENPVIADVDNDGNAEIVFATSNESGFCSERGNTAAFNNGLEVFGDASDLWVSARRIYNQHSYHVTNVFEGGGIPTREPESWRPYGGRIYNTYRSQPRSFGIAPDLIVNGIQVSSPDAACGMLSNTIDITARVVNQGDVRVGPGVVIAFHGIWSGVPLDEPLYADMAMTPLTSTLMNSIEPQGELLITVRYEAQNNSPRALPNEVRVTVDETMAERECLEDNNTMTVPVAAGDAIADLLVELGAIGGDCPEKTFETTVTNQGSAPASNVLVRYFAGDPAAGGTSIHEETVAGPITPGGTTTFTATIPSFPRRSVLVYATVDPDDAIRECNDGNNTDAADERASCNLIF
ncbi:MAG: FG-GAP-like repeat-containing protein [Myxococcota bacterium]